VSRHRPITWEDCEDAARHLHALYGLTFARHVDPVGLAGLLHARLEPAAPRGCRGVGLLALPLRLHDAGEPESLAHEILHVALEVIGVPPIHHPDRLIELASPVIEMPRGPLRRTLERVGLDAWALLREYPKVRPSRLYIRAALAVDGVVVLHRGRRRKVVAHNDDAPMVLVPHERVLVEAVRSSGRPCWQHGAGAWPYSDGPHDRGNVVVMATADDGIASPKVGDIQMA
jgi:hypothetical protein